MTKFTDVNGKDIDASMIAELIKCYDHRNDTYLMFFFNGPAGLEEELEGIRIELRATGESYGYKMACDASGLAGKVALTENLGRQMGMAVTVIKLKESPQLYELGLHPHSPDSMFNALNQEGRASIPEGNPNIIHEAMGVLLYHIGAGMVFER